MAISASRRRWSRFAVLVGLTALAWCRPQTASAWHGRWHVGGWGYQPGCGPISGPGFSGGWGGWYGATRFSFSNSVYIGGPCGGFYSGGIRSFVIGGPAWCGPAWYGPAWCVPAWGGCHGWPRTWYPYGCGWGLQPIVVSPFVGSIAPVYGPAGVLPYMGTFPGMGFVGAATAMPTMTPANRPMIAARPPAAADLARLAAGRPDALPQAPSPRLAGRLQTAPVVVRSSNGLARLRAGRLVAIGDRHLRTAVHEPAKLAAALDAYRRAATIAPDLPDTYLRQAITLTALDRGGDAMRAIERAIAIDSRLGNAPAGALAARDQAPPDPVFGERPDGVPTSLESRGADLLARIFSEPAAGGAVVAEAAAGPRLNWIADRWTRLHGDEADEIRRDAVAAK